MLRPIDLTPLAPTPFQIPDALDKTREQLWNKTGASNAEADKLPDTRRNMTAAEKSAVVRWLDGQLAIRYQIGQYLASVDVLRPAAIADSIEKTRAIHDSVKAAVAKTLAGEHPDFMPPCTGHPTVVAAEAKHSAIHSYPVLAWRRSNSEIIDELKKQRSRLG